MSVYRAQAHLDAPVEDVWALVGNPATYPEWWPAAVEIRGETFEVGDVFTQVVGIAGRPEYSRIIDGRDELKELRWSCPTTGGFQRWLLTDAQGGTIRFHDLRHHFGSLAITVLDPYAVQSYMGHQHYSTTQRYLHHKPRREDALRLQAAADAQNVSPNVSRTGVDRGELRAPERT
jgi:hypothetical protein